MGRRTLLLIASILVAAAGTAMIWLYVQHADDRARAGMRLVSVLVATKDINPGTAVSQLSAQAQKSGESSVEVRRVPVDSAPPADSRVSSLDDLSGQSTTALIHKGEWLLRAQFSATKNTQITPGKAALGVTMSDPNRVAGLLRPGLHVAVYVVTTKGEAPTAKLLLPDVRVLAVGNTTPVTNANGTPAKIGTQAQVSPAVVTLEVDGAQTTRILVGQEVGDLYFTLLGQDFVPRPGDDAAVPNLYSRAGD